VIMSSARSMPQGALTIDSLRSMNQLAWTQ
jgi:hypothetical protein